MFDVNNPILVSMSQWALGIHHIDNDMIFRFRIVSLELEVPPELKKSYSDRNRLYKKFSVKLSSKWTVLENWTVS